jgi:hypothetical protein
MLGCALSNTTELRCFHKDQAPSMITELSPFLVFFGRPLVAVTVLTMNLFVVHIRVEIDENTRGRKSFRRTSRRIINLRYVF